jgi:hypothetical protein
MNVTASASVVALKHEPLLMGVLLGSLSAFQGKLMARKLGPPHGASLSPGRGYWCRPHSRPSGQKVLSRSYTKFRFDISNVICSLLSRAWNVMKEDPG